MTTSAERLTEALSGRYRIERELGAGGMATVYLAHDERHDRKVAIKVLKPELAAVLGAERFVVEIKTTAALSHPHILPLFDSGTADGFLFYVMPFIEGETIREKLNRETQFGVDEAVRIAREVADALDYAHRHGVIHRDIKPENLLLHDGRAMVMDFGIALAVSAAAGGRMTETGLSLGTPHYMSPEQATAEKEITGRSDEYSLASVLYEMLAGQPPHVGGPAQQVIMRIITEPSRPVSEFRKNVPSNVTAALAKALEKLPADRFESAKAFADALGNPAYRSAGGAADSASAIPGRSRVVGLAGWAAATAMALVAGWQWRARRAEVEPEQPVIRAIVFNNLRSDALGPTALAISNDGSQIAYRRPDSTGVWGFFVRSLATNVDVHFGGSTSGNPFFAPDGGSVGYFTGGELRVHSLTGGDRTVLEVGMGSTGVWGTDGFITIATQRAVIRVAASGGKPDTLAVFDADHRLLNPSLSQDGRTVILSLGARGQGLVATLVALSIDTRKIVPLGIAGTRPVLVADRWLTYTTVDGFLHVVSFDLRTLKPGTDSRVISQDIALSPTSLPRIAVAPLNGTAVYVSGGSERDKELALLDRSGRGGAVVAETRAFRAPRFSPDGQRIAVGVTITSFASGDVWIATIANHGFVRATSDSVSFHPNWEADGRHLLVIKRTERRALVFRMPTDGTSPATKLIERPSMVYEAVALPDGRGTVFREDATSTNRDVYLQPSDSGSAPVPLAATAFDEKGVAVSPDSKWIAYASNESGVNEVYIRRIEAGSPRWPVSHGGGTEPRWARNGELFFRRADSVFVTRVAAGAEPKVAPPTHLFTAQFDATGYEPVWDVSPDGSHFAVTRTREGAATTQLIVLVNALRAARQK